MGNIGMGINSIFGAVGNVISAPFQLAGGLLQTAAGVAQLPFQMAGGLLGGLFGGGSPMGMRGAQMGIMPFL